MSFINAKTNDHRLMLISSPLITSNSKAADTVHILFDKSWDIDGAVRYIQFVKNGDVITFELSNDTASVPPEVLSEPGRFTFAVFAKKGDEIIKTSSFCSYAVLKGPDTDAVIVNWDLFRRSLINLLNSRFSFGMSDTAGVDDILAALETAEDGAAVKKFFVDLLNGSVFTGLEYDESYDDIALNVSVQADRFNVTLSELSALVRRLKDLYDEYFGGSSEIEIEPAYLLYMSAIENYIQTEMSIQNAEEVMY